VKIVELLQRTGAELTDRGNGKFILSCPLCSDKRKRAAVWVDGGFDCKNCGERLSYSALKQKLGVFESQPLAPLRTKRVRPRSTEEVEALWESARKRVLTRKDSDEEIYAYLRSRGLLDVLKSGECGILPPEESQELLRHRFVVPLRREGRVVSMQGRAVSEHKIKWKTLGGTTTCGGAFFRKAGSLILVAEGASDYLALCLSTEDTVVSAPGCGSLVDLIGPWVCGRRIVVCGDGDYVGSCAASGVASAARRWGATVRQWSGRYPDVCEALLAGGSRAIRKEIDADGG